MTDDLGLEMVDLSVIAGDHSVLSDVNRRVGRGQVLLISGPPASGKSSVLAVFAGERSPRGGYVAFDGQLTRTPAAQARLGYAPQFSRILDTLTTLENVALPLLADAVPADEAWQRAGDALDQLGLANSSWHNLAEQLSGGQRQRVALARVTVSRPALLVVDDPTSELDRETASRVRDSIAELQHAGSTVVLASGDPALMELAGDYIGLG